MVQSSTTQENRQGSSTRKKPVRSDRKRPKKGTIHRNRNTPLHGSISPDNFYANFGDKFTVEEAYRSAVRTIESYQKFFSENRNILDWDLRLKKGMNVFEIAGMLKGKIQGLEGKEGYQVFTPDENDFDTTIGESIIAFKGECLLDYFYFSLPIQDIAHRHSTKEDISVLHNMVHLFHDVGVQYSDTWATGSLDWMGEEADENVMYYERRKEKGEKIDEEDYRYYLDRKESFTNTVFSNYEDFESVVTSKKVKAKTLLKKIDKTTFSPEVKKACKDWVRYNDGKSISLDDYTIYGHGNRLYTSEFFFFLKTFPDDVSAWMDEAIGVDMQESSGLIFMCGEIITEDGIKITDKKWMQLTIEVFSKLIGITC